MGIRQGVTAATGLDAVYVVYQANDSKVDIRYLQDDGSSIIWYQIDKNGNNMKYKHLILSLSLIMLGPLAHAEEIGSVDTVFKMIGPDHKIVVEAFDDPDVKNVTCYVSRAKTGGIKGGLGLAEDTSDAAISCQQVGPIELSDRIKNGKAQGEVVFKKRTSLVFKSLQVVRFYDAKRNALAYLAYSDKVVEGSPKNAISAVPVMPWRQ